MLNSRSSGDEDSSPREQNGAQTEQLPPLHHVESEDLLEGMQEAERQETRAAYNGDEETNQEQKLEVQDEIMHVQLQDKLAHLRSNSCNSGNSLAYSASQSSPQKTIQ